jgi:hypothetical protein
MLFFYPENNPYFFYINLFFKFYIIYITYIVFDKYINFYSLWAMFIFFLFHFELVLIWFDAELYGIILWVLQLNSIVFLICTWVIFWDILYSVFVCEKIKIYHYRTLLIYIFIIIYISRYDISGFLLFNFFFKYYRTDINSHLYRIRMFDNSLVFFIISLSFILAYILALNFIIASIFGIDSIRNYINYFLKQYNTIYKYFFKK